jgi:hypothetical protein
MHTLRGRLFPGLVPVKEVPIKVAPAALFGNVAFMPVPHRRIPLFPNLQIGCCRRAVVGRYAWWPPGDSEDSEVGLSFNADGRSQSR